MWSSLLAMRPRSWGLVSNLDSRIRHLSSNPLGVTVCSPLRTAQNLGLFRPEAMLHSVTEKESTQTGWLWSWEYVLLSFVTLEERHCLVLASRKTE